MKYRLTPFHLVALYFFGEGIYDLYVLSNVGDTELGELVPYVYFAFGLITLFIDLLIQLIVWLTVKSNPKRILYVIEASLIVIGLIWVWLTFYPTVHNE